MDLEWIFGKKWIGHNNEKGLNGTKQLENIDGPSNKPLLPLFFALSLFLKMITPLKPSIIVVDVCCSEYVIHFS